MTEKCGDVKKLESASLLAREIVKSSGDKTAMFAMAMNAVLIGIEISNQAIKDQRSRQLPPPRTDGQMET